MKIKTIIVDDETRIRRGIERMVSTCGDDWEIIGTFSDGIEVIEFIKDNQTRIDLLITDVKMPEMDGLTLINEVKRTVQNHHMHSIIVSGHDDFQYLQKAIREGTFEYVLKPIDRSEFLDLLQRAKNNIYKERRKSDKWNDLMKNEDKLLIAKQTQQLSAAVLSGQDDISTMYWIKDFPEGTYQLLFVSADEFPIKTREYSSKDWGVMAYAFQNIIDEVVMDFAAAKEGNMGWWWSDGGFNFWVLLFGSSNEKKPFEMDREDFSNKLRTCMSRYTPFSVSIAQSDPFEDLSILTGLRKQLLLYIRFRIIYGGNRVFSSLSTHDIMLKEERPVVPQALRDHAHRITIALGHSSISDIEEELNGFFSEMVKLRLPSDIQLTIQYFIYDIYKVCMESIKSGKFFNELENSTEVIKAKTNLNQIKDLVKRIVFQVHEILLNYQRDNVHDPIEKAKTWIKNHYEQKISVKEISDQVYMNPNYFCEYFKRQTGKTVFDYVTDVRLEKAKELLMGTNLKIGEITERVGYQNTKYFSRLFKQKWGRLPSDYKRRSMEDLIESNSISSYSNRP